MSAREHQRRLAILAEHKRVLCRLMALDVAMSGLRDDYDETALEGIRIFQLETAKALIVVQQKLHEVFNIPEEQETEAPMPRIDRGLGRLRPISYTASEIMARHIVDRLCQEPPYGLSWKEFAVREIARTLVVFAKAHTSTPPTAR